MTKDDLVLFLDGIGRTLLGEKVGDTKTTLEVKNPSVLHVQPNSENGQIQVQLIPVFFKEFAAPDSDGTWNFNKNNIVQYVSVSCLFITSKCNVCKQRANHM